MQEKRQRNSIYALRYKQRKCKDCGHRSSRPGVCRHCGSPRMRGRKRRR